MKKLILILIAFSIAACADNSDQTNLINSKFESAENSDRFTVTKVSKFKDTDAYNQYRCIYLIKDNLKNKEYLGVSGIGVSELGSHPEGEEGSPVADER